MTLTLKKMILFSYTNRMRFSSKPQFLKSHPD